MNAASPSRSLVLVLALAAPLAAQAGPILPAEQHVTGNSPLHSAAGDLSADGRPDLAVAHGAGHVLAVLASDGLGSFLPRATHDVGGAAAEVALGALGGGAGLDAVVAIPSAGVLAVLLDDGAGGFAQAAYYPAGETPVSVALGDVDGDGDGDAACARQFFAAVNVLPGDGQGGFGAPLAVAVGGKAVDAALADADLDGDLDLLVANEATQALQLCKGDGAGGFGAPASYGSCAYISRLEVGDLDANGYPDGVFATHNVFGEQLPILLGGPGGFASSPETGVALTERCAIADVDGDGDLDLAWPQVDRMSLQLGDGAGGFGAPGVKTIRFGVGLSTATFDDFDQDGVLDAAACIDSYAALARGLGAGAYAAAQPLALAKHAIDAAAFDADADGLLDVALYQVVPGGSGEDVLALALGLGGGALAPPSRVAGFPSLGAAGFGAGDLDGDGVVDLVAGHVGSAPPPGLVHAFLGDGAAGFAPAGVFPVSPGSVEALALADLDQDGALDVVAGTSTGLLAQNGALSVLRNTGAGGFAPAVAIAAGGYLDVAAGDVDQDGAPDVAGAFWYESRLTVVRSDGAGGFLAPTSVATSVQPLSVGLGDLGGDLLPDLVGAGEVDPSNGRVQVFPGDGLGGFGAPASLAAGAKPAWVTLADLDGDGRRDLAVTCESAHRVGAFLADGAGGLAAERGFGTGFEPTALAAADLDADGLVDLAVAHDQYTELYVLLGQRPAPAGTLGFGAGTPGCGGGHGLVASGPPHVGDAGFALLSSNAPPFGAGVRLVGLGAYLSGSDPAGLGVLLHVDPFVAPFLVAATFTADAAGQGVSPLPIPPQAGLAGVTVHAQAIWLWTGACKPTPLGLSSSAGLHLTVLP